ncbi:hypothetical protein ACFOD4_04500 [Pseudoroseomonas globiformis]|uniref:Uncharacterized protein n=1 Tax=Teichococcus globiformis TaxID=2307229 RepID=A0ABV7FZY1_9PROT
MTVAELIAALSGLPPDAEVIADDLANGWLLGHLAIVVAEDGTVHIEAHCYP